MSLRDQAVGTLANVRSLLSSATLDSLVPPSVYTTLVWARDTIPRAFGFSSRTGHITGIIGFTAVLIIGSFTILTAVAVLFFVAAIPIATLRLIPAVNDRWPFAPEDWPLWEVRT